MSIVSEIKVPPTLTPAAYTVAPLSSAIHTCVIFPFPITAELFRVTLAAAPIAILLVGAPWPFPVLALFPIKTLEDPPITFDPAPLPTATL